VKDQKYSKMIGQVFRCWSHHISAGAQNTGDYILLYSCLVKTTAEYIPVWMERGTLYEVYLHTREDPAGPQEQKQIRRPGKPDVLRSQHERRNSGPGM